jgi:hypothetical protein
MYRDEVIEEVWRIRDEYVKQHHFSLDEIVEDLHRRETGQSSRIVDRRQPPSVENASSGGEPGTKPEPGCSQR